MEYHNDINILIDKYLQGLTSLKEELEIKEYFASNNNIPKKHLAVKMMFDFYKSEQQAVSKVQMEDIVGNSSTKRRTLIVSVLSIAASILLILSIALFQQQDKFEEEQIYAYINGKAVTDKEIAIIETKKALLTISNNLNEGTKNLTYLQKINKAQEIKISN